MLAVKTPFVTLIVPPDTKLAPVNENVPSINLAELSTLEIVNVPLP